MTDIPVQPTQEELDQFEEAPTAPKQVKDNTKGVPKDELAKVSGKDVDPTQIGKVEA